MGVTCCHESETFDAPTKKEILESQAISRDLTVVKEKKRMGTDKIEDFELAMAFDNIEIGGF